MSQNDRSIGFNSKPVQAVKEDWSVLGVGTRRDEDMAWQSLLMKAINEDNGPLLSFDTQAYKVKDTFQEILAKIEGHHAPKLIIRQYKEKKRMNRVYIWPDAIAYVSLGLDGAGAVEDMQWDDEVADDSGEKIIATVRCHAASTFDTSLFDYLAETFVQAPEKSQIYTIYETTRGSLSYMTSGMLHEELVRENYDDNVLESYDKIVSEYLSDDPCGKLTILYGPPGTGKTYLIRALITELGKEGVMVLVPPSLVPKLGDPKFIPVLKEMQDEHSKPIYLLIEDADTILSDRTSDNINHISSALNLGDGILGQMFDIRLVCTANVELSNLDSAITRPGRLLDITSIDTLSEKTIDGLLKKHNLTKDMLPVKEDGLTLAEVYKVIKDEQRKNNN